MIEVLKVDDIDIIINERKEDNDFSLICYFKTGSKNENKDEKGISHFLEHMMFNGTSKKTSFEITEELDYYGVSTNAYTSKNITNYYFSSLSKYQERVMDIFFDMITDPIFSNESIEKEKEIICEEIRMDKDDIRSVCYEEVEKELIKGNLRYNILGSEEDVKSITREKLFDYYKKRYTRDNMGIIVSGNIDKEILLSKIKIYFSKLPRFSEIRKYESELIFKNSFIPKDINQVNVYFMKDITNIKSIKDRLILSIIDSVLGEGFSSRLFNEVREKKALAYSVYSFIQTNLDLNIHNIYIGTSKNKYNEAIDITRKVLEELRENGIKERELEKVKNAIISNRSIVKENSKLASRLLGMYNFYKKIYSEKELYELIDSIDLEDVNNMAKILLKDYSLCVVGAIDGK